MISNFYSEKELKEIGFKKIGKNVLISRKCSIYGEQNMEIGNFVRIDDFCILSGKIKIHDYVHISAYCALYGSKGIEIGDFSGISTRGIIYSAIDDFSGNYMIGPMVPPDLTNVTGGSVKLEKYVQLGANSIVMPNLIIKEGAVSGAFTFINKDVEAWTINVGIPFKVIKTRKKKLKERAKELDMFLGEKNE